MIDTTTKTLPVRAKDNYGHTYPVYLELSTGPSGQFCGPKAEELTAKYTNRWVLRIGGTGAQWYVSTLLATRGTPDIWLDYGQGWKCTNFMEVMVSALDNI